MSEPSIIDVFGPGATQTATQLIILKADLFLTVAALNRAEQMFAGVCKRAQLNLTQAAFDADPDRSIVITPGYDSLVYRTIGGSPATFLQSPLTIGFAKQQASSGIDPDSY